MIIPKQFDVIKHEKHSDVAFQVEKIFRLHHKWKIKGTWLNQGYVKTWSIGLRDKFDIPVEKLSEWMFCAEPLAKCIRHEKWIYLMDNKDEI